MKSHVCRTLLLLIAASCFGQGSSSSGTDPLIGRWHWIDSDIEIHADGTVTGGRTGSWISIPSENRKYQFRFGPFVDDVTLSQDGAQLDVKNQFNQTMTASRIDGGAGAINAPADSIPTAVADSTPPPKPGAATYFGQAGPGQPGGMPDTTLEPIKMTPDAAANPTPVTRIPQGQSIPGTNTGTGSSPTPSGDWMFSDNGGGSAAAIPPHVLDGSNWRQAGNAWVGALRFNNGWMTVIPRAGTAHDTAYNVGTDGNIHFWWDNRAQEMTLSPGRTEIHWGTAGFQRQ